MQVFHTRSRVGRARIATVMAAAAAVPFLIALGATPPAATAATSCPWVNSTAPVATRVSELMAQMSLTQEIDMMTGTSGSYVGNVAAISSLCIPAMNLEDGRPASATG